MSDITIRTHLRELADEVENAAPTEYRRGYKDAVALMLEILDQILWEEGEE